LRPMPNSATRPRSTAGRITAEKIVDAALALTVECGLDNWTLRRLAAAVGAYPAVIYHHVGDRDAVVEAVLERVVGGLDLPDRTLPWQEWFARLLTNLREMLRLYPGCARRLALSAPSGSGVEVLREAGFGRESDIAYHLLIATACQFVAMEDDRDGVLTLRLDNTEEYASYHARLYEYAVQRCLDGLAHRLRELRGNDMAVS